MILWNVWHYVTQHNVPEHGLHDIKTKVQWSSEAVGTVKNPLTQCNIQEYRLLDTEGEGMIL
jgi:hypothetical protein